jgi:hypothetical protein
MILLSALVDALGYLCTSSILRLRDPSEGTNPFLIKFWIAIGAFGPIFFILLKLGLFH